MKVLVVIDMQKDFVTGALANEEAQKIVSSVSQKIQLCRQNGYQIIFTRDTHQADYLETSEGRKLPVPHCIEGSDGWNILDELPVEDAIILNKPTFGTMELGTYIQGHFEDVEEIELIGVCTDICVVSNALILKAMLPETPVIVDSTCCAGITIESHEAALTTMKMCQVDVR